MNIYEGVPLKVYLGPRKLQMEGIVMTHFFTFDQAQNLIEAVFQEYEKLTESANEIYDKLLAKKDDS
jgi:hypothetical protein